MKKLLSLFACGMIVISAIAGPVTLNGAQEVARNFFGKISNVSVSKVSLAYTETDQSGNEVYYVFNINNNDGFVIVSADDNQHPIIGYSTEKRQYTIPQPGTNIYYWMQKRKAEIIANVSQNVSACPDIVNEWHSYSTNGTLVKSNHPHRATGSSKFPSSSVYLVQTTWDQEMPYDNYCPGTGSTKAITGCVATAMCQIMRYWQWPATGQYASSYTDATYGTLYASYAHPYPWSAMQLTSPTSADTALSRVMSDAGISVDMGYSPTGSGAWVISSDNPICAQNSYVQYFKYDANTIDGEYAFSDQLAWADTIMHELDCGRPVQYVGYDPSVGGHTWVCDGYDSAGSFHMNWGWSGADNGWYLLNNLNPGGMFFSQNIEAVVGIEPPPVAAAPVAYFTTASNVQCTKNLVQFVDTSINEPTSWNWSFPGGTPSSSTLRDPQVSYDSAGKYSFSLTVSNKYGSNTISRTNYITIIPNIGNLNVVQSANDDTLTCTPSNLSYYQWYRNGVAIPGANSYWLFLWQKGVYYVHASDSIGCAGLQEFVVTVTNVNNISGIDNNITVYPNPVSDKINIESTIATPGDYMVSLTNVLGQTVYSAKKHLENGSVNTIDVTGFGSGIYFLSVKGNSGTTVKKIVITE